MFNLKAFYFDLIKIVSQLDIINKNNFEIIIYIYISSDFSKLIFKTLSIFIFVKLKKKICKLCKIIQIAFFLTIALITYNLDFYFPMLVYFFKLL